MNTFTYRTIILLLSTALVFMIWRYAQLDLALEESQFKAERMEDHATELEKQVLALENALQKAEARSIDNVLERTGEKVLDSWRSLLGEFEQRLDEAKKELEQELEQNP